MIGTIDLLSTDEKHALSEISYAVTAQGKILKQARFIPILAMIRLITRLAGKVDPSLEARFENQGWQKFRQAIEIRHRLTHPKSQEDLGVSIDDLATSNAGFEWLLALCMTAMESANIALSTHGTKIRAILDGLKRGDPAILAVYQEASKSLED